MGKSQQFNEYREPIYGGNDKYIQTEIKPYGNKVNTNFQGK